jgi:hypothetical protein
MQEQGGDEETTMPMQASRRRRAVAAAMAVVSLSLPLLLLAQSDRQAGAARAATAHSKWHKHVRAAREKPAGPSLNVTGCSPPYTNKWPPCQSTFPEGDPTYSGSTGAP